MTLSALSNHKFFPRMPLRTKIGSATDAVKWDTYRNTIVLKAFGATIATEKDTLRVTARIREEHPALQTIQTTLHCHQHQGPTDK